MKAILNKLLVADDSSGDVKEINVSNVWRKSDDKLTATEMQTIVNLANSLRLYVPRSSVPSIPVTTIKFVILANQLLRASGYHDFPREICPVVSPAAIYVLPLDADVVYTLFGSTSAPFDLNKEDGTVFTNSREAIRENEAVLASFFDTDKIKKIYKECVLEPHWRVIITNHGTVYIDGTVCEEWHPVISQYEKRKAKSKKQHIDKQEPSQGRRGNITSVKSELEQKTKSIKELKVTARTQSEQLKQRVD